MNTTEHDPRAAADNDYAQAPQADASSYQSECVRLVNAILPLWSSARNVWRTAWAMDTLVDFFAISGFDSSGCEAAAMEGLNPMNNGGWWDDFGWIGIAALRAADHGFVPGRRDDFVRIAINSWAYMHGPGWSLTPTKAVYPFATLPGWDKFAAANPNNTGTSNAWKVIDQTRPDPQPPAPPNAWIAPRFSGGAWNSPITTDQYPYPVKFVLDTWSPPYLNPAQNTVTNGGYTLLSLRLHQASLNPAYAQIFRDSGVDVAACRAAWIKQVGWFDQWMADTIPAESLLSRLQSGALMRERVSTFAPVASNQGQSYWDAMFRQDLFWTGDQGLLIGALRESKAAWTGAPPASLTLYPQIVQGVFDNVYQPRSYSATPGRYPLPWLDIGVSDPYTASPPGDDYANYATGVAVFMRYALQAYDADPTLLAPYRALVVGTANGVVQSGFGANAYPAGACDAFAAAGGSPEDQMTPYVNSLSILLLAIRMTR